VEGGAESGTEASGETSSDDSDDSDTDDRDEDDDRDPLAKEIEADPASNPDDPVLGQIKGG
jgi:hypothetical protein